MVNRKKARHVTVMLIIISLVLFGGTRSMLFSPRVPNAILSYPLYFFLYAQHMIMKPVKNMIERVHRIADLEKLVITLSQEKEDLLAQNVSLNASLHFIDETKELVDFQKTYTKLETHLTHILLKQFSEQGHYYIVDIGSKHGATVDMVAVYKNCLVGRVVQVYPLFSKVVLITDRSCKVAALCVDTNTQGIYEGMNDEHMSALAHVSHLEVLQKNSLVISSGQGLVFPQGLALGRIRYFALDGVYYIIRLSPLLDLRSLSYCHLLQKGEEKL